MSTSGWTVKATTVVDLMPFHLEVLATMELGLKGTSTAYWTSSALSAELPFTFHIYDEMNGTNADRESYCYVNNPDLKSSIRFVKDK